VIGPVVEREFPPGVLPEIFTALTLSNPSISDQADNLTIEVAQHLGGEHRALHRDGRDRRSDPRPAGQEHRRAPSRCRSAKACWAASSTWWARPVDEKGPIHATRRLPIHRDAQFIEQEPFAWCVRDRHQGHRPARAYLARQDRLFRRRRRGHGAPPGIDQQRRQERGGFSVFEGSASATREGNDL